MVSSPRPIRTGLPTKGCVWLGHFSTIKLGDTVYPLYNGKLILDKMLVLPNGMTISTLDLVNFIANVHNYPSRDHGFAVTMVDDILYFHHVPSFLTQKMLVLNAAVGNNTQITIRPDSLFDCYSVAPSPIVPELRKREDEDRQQEVNNWEDDVIVVYPITPDDPKPVVVTINGRGKNEGDDPIVNEIVIATKPTGGQPPTPDMILSVPDISSDHTMIDLPNEPVFYPVVDLVRPKTHTAEITTYCLINSKGEVSDYADIVDPIFNDKNLRSDLEILRANNPSYLITWEAKPGQKFSPKQTEAPAVIIITFTSAEGDVSLWSTHATDKSDSDSRSNEAPLPQEVVPIADDTYEYEVSSSGTTLSTW